MSYDIKKAASGDAAFYVLEALDYVQRSFPNVAFYPHPPQRYENILKNRCSIFRFYSSVFRFFIVQVANGNSEVFTVRYLDAPSGARQVNNAQPSRRRHPPRYRPRARGEAAESAARSASDSPKAATATEQREGGSKRSIKTKKTTIFFGLGKWLFFIFLLRYPSAAHVWFCIVQVFILPGRICRQNVFNRILGTWYKFADNHTLC